MLFLESAVWQLSLGKASWRLFELAPFFMEHNFCFKKRLTDKVWFFKCGDLATFSHKLIKGACHSKENCWPYLFSVMKLESSRENKNLGGGVLLYYKSKPNGVLILKSTFLMRLVVVMNAIFWSCVMKCIVGNSVLVSEPIFTKGLLWDGTKSCIHKDPFKIQER